MGSGLILLVIVGAWLAVLVPMALRSHDATSSLSSVDRFNDAMRVLSRRDSMARLRERAVVTPPAPRPSRRSSADEPREVHGRAVVDGPGRPRVSVAQRRRRVLALLLLLAGGTLAGGLRGPVWVLGVSAFFGLLAVVYVVHLRRQALRRERERRAAVRPAARRAPRPSARPSARPAASARIAGIPDRLPGRPAPRYAPVAQPSYEPAASQPAAYHPAAYEATATAQRYDDPAPVPAAIGSAWSPVPVPVPTYVNAPMAPPRPARVVDLTSPGRYSDALREAEERLGIVDHGPELDDILDRRRAVNGW